MATRCMGCMQMKEKSPICEHCGYDERTHSKSHQLPVGTVVGGQYTLGRVLGQGGFGITYIGWDNVMNQRVAVKEYFPTGYAGRDTRTTMEVTSYDGKDTHSFEDNKRRFLREAESLAKLWNISQIVRVLRHFEENGTAYIAMEYAEGEDLRNYMKRLGRPMTMDEVMDILGPVMEALNHVHKAELVHRDISPDNIMVLPDGTTKLLDFGAARYVENADAEKDRNTSTQAILKHGFAPPEQYRSRGALGPWTDIYAMCATVYYCLAGRVPPESMSRMMGEADLEIDNLPGLTQQQKAALTNGMALMPKARTKTAGALYTQLFSELIAAREAAEKAELERKAREEAEKRRLEEEKKQEQVRKEAALKKEQERREATAKKEQERREAAAKKEQARKAEEERRKEAAAAKARERKEARERKQDAGPSGKAKSGKMWIPAVAAVLVLAAGLALVFGRKPAAQEASVQVPEPAGTVTAVETTQETISDTIPETIPQTTAAQVELVLDAALLEWEIPEPGQSGKTIPILSEHAPEAIRWTSSDPQVVTVSENGTLTAAGYGSAEITASWEGQNVVCTVIVYPEPNITCTYEGTSTGVTITGYEGTLPAQVVLPRMIDGKPVIGIGDYAFQNCTAITSVWIPYGVTSIGWKVFDGCSQLADIVIPRTLTSVQPDAFRFTPWLKAQTDEFVICGDGLLLKYNGISADVEIPAGVKTIADAFHGNGVVKHVVIPEGVTSIGTYAFRRCPGLNSIQISSSVTVIGASAFEDSGFLNSITLEEGVKTIGNRAFFNCNGLTEVTLPDSVTKIETAAFDGCRNLTSINIPNGVKKIESYAFANCSKLTSMTLPEGVTSIGHKAFDGCFNLTEITIPQSVRVITDQGFSGCSNLKSVTISESCKLYQDSLPSTCTVSYY